MIGKISQHLAKASFVAVLAIPLAGIASFEALFAPKADLWERWTAHDADSPATIDHSAWDRLLRSYVMARDGVVNRYDYRNVSKQDRKALDAYIAGLSRLPIGRYSRPEQLAYWINLYNALTVQVVLAHYPVESIRDIDISPGLFADGPWDKKLVTIDGEAVSLNDIEHRILRPIWRDPRIHYAVNCASIGCPDLRKTAFTGANAEASLDAAARAFVNHPRGARVEGGELNVSSIYVWFQEDFGGDDRGVIAHLRQYARPALKEKLAAVSEIAAHSYDWALNRPPRDGS